MGVFMQVGRSGYWGTLISALALMSFMGCATTPEYMKKRGPIKSVKMRGDYLTSVYGFEREVKRIHNDGWLTSIFQQGIVSRPQADEYAEWISHVGYLISFRNTPDGNSIATIYAGNQTALRSYWSNRILEAGSACYLNPPDSDK